MLNNVRRWYKDYVETHMVIPKELKEALRTSDRVPSFIDNLSVGIKKAQFVLLKRGRKPASMKTLKGVVEDYTELFLNGLINESNSRIESEIAKYEKEDKIRQQKEIEDASEGKMTGAFEDMGLEVPEAEQKKQELDPVDENKIITY